ncbi:MAG: hypothetical protein V4736_01205 [Bdellovibrionota bacterium]
MVRQILGLQVSNILQHITDPYANLESLPISDNDLKQVLRILPERDYEKIPILTLRTTNETAFEATLEGVKVNFDFRDFKKGIVYFQEKKLEVNSGKSFNDYVEIIGKVLDNKKSQSQWKFQFLISNANAAAIPVGFAPRTRMQTYVATLFATVSGRTRSFKDSNLTLEDYLIQDAVRNAKNEQRLNSRLRGRRKLSYTDFACSGNKLQRVREFNEYLEIPGSPTPPTGVSREFARTSTGWVLRDLGGIVNRQQVFGVEIVTDANGVIKQDRSRIKPKNTDGYYARDRHLCLGKTSELGGIGNISGIDPGAFGSCVSGPTRYHPPLTFYGSVGESIYTEAGFTQYTQLAQACCARAGCYQKFAEAIGAVKETLRVSPNGTGRTGQ